MKPFFILVLGACVLPWLGAEAADDLLARVDAQRAIPHMTFDMQITSYAGDQVKESNTLLGFIQSTEDQNKTLIWFSGPGSVKGRKMLMDGNTVYLLFPRTRNPIRLSPLQVLTGESSNGDVARTGFAQEYQAVSVETVQKDGVEAWRFELSPKENRKSSTYRRVVLWVNKANLQPLFAEFYTTSDKPLKTIRYANYGSVGGKMVPFLMDIANGEDPTRHTVMTYKTIANKALPDQNFNREYLESWSPE